MARPPGERDKLHALAELCRFVLRGDYSPRAKRHAKGLLLALFDI